MGSFEYKNGELNQVFTEEGRIRYDEAGDDFYYDYYLKDHLGNIRVVFTNDGKGNPEVLQANNYYPFGMRFNQAPVVNKQDNDYLYNGKELQKFGLDWYDYGARFYDPQLGRFTGIDPIADKFPHVSTFNYAENEPINSIDLWGLQRLSLADKMWSDYEEESKNRWRFMGTESDSTSSVTPLINTNSSENNGKEEGESAETKGGGTEEGYDFNFAKNFAGYTGWSSAVWGDAAKYTLQTLSQSDAAFSTIKGIGIGARFAGYAGMVTSLSLNVYNAYQNPTWGNYGRVAISGLSIGANVAFPGPGTLFGFGMITLDATGAIDGFYNYLDFNQKLYNSSGSLMIPTSPTYISFSIINIKTK